MSELIRLASRGHAEELGFILRAAGIDSRIERVREPNGDPDACWSVLVSEAELLQARQILREEGFQTGPPRRETTQPLKRPLYWVVGVVVLNLLVWIAMEGRGGSESRQVLLRFGASHAPSLRAGQWWRLVTAVFLHIGLRHLLANMITLAILGPAVLQGWGAGRFYFIYLLAGAAGNLLSFTLSPTGAVKAGASGSILGLLGVLGGTRIRAIRSGGATPGRFRTWHIIAMLVAFYGFVVGVGHADHLAHIGGLVVGALLALLLPLPGQLPPRKDRLLAVGLGGVAAAVCLVAALLAFTG